VRVRATALLLSKREEGAACRGSLEQPGHRTAAASHRSHGEACENSREICGGHAENCEGCDKTLCPTFYGSTFANKKSA